MGSRQMSQLVRYWYRLRYARILGVSVKEIDISGPCVIHGGGCFAVGRGVAIRATRRLPVELFCARGATLSLANGCFLNQGVHIACSERVSVGEGSLLADQVLVMDTDFHAVGSQLVKTASVTIGAGAWIGARAIVLKGVAIGDGAVIGAGAVVTRSIPPRVLAAGNPARVIRAL